MVLIRESLPQATIFQASDYDTLIAALKKQAMDLVLYDINMPGCNSFEVVEEMKELQPSIRILVFSAYPEEVYGRRYLQAGVNGYLHKDSDSHELQRAVAEVLETGKYKSPAMQAQLQQGNRRKEKTGNVLENLSDREIEVARLLLQGNGLLEISNVLNIHVATVSTYKRRIYEKLNITSLPDLIAVFRNYSDLAP